PDRLAQVLVREAVPGALVPAPQQVEAQAGPPVGELARAPVRLDVKGDLAGPVVLLEDEPLPAGLDVSSQRLEAEAEHAVPLVSLVTDGADADGAEEVEPQRLELEEHGPVAQVRVVPPVADDDARVGESEPRDEEPCALVHAAGLRRSGLLHADGRMREDVVPSCLPPQIAFRSAGRQRRGRREPRRQLLAGPGPQQAPFRHQSALAMAMSISSPSRSGPLPSAEGDSPSIDAELVVSPISLRVRRIETALWTHGREAGGGH